MEDTIQRETVGHTDNVAPVTDSASKTVDNTATDTKSEKTTTPSVENRDGKLFVDGARVYTRDDVNKIGANAKKEAESRILNELNVDSFDSVKSVVQTLQETTPSEEGSQLNVNALRDAVKKREATVEELKAQVNSLKTDLLLKDHMGQLNNAMPSSWTPTQKESVLKLMKADGMMAVEGDTFALRNGNEFLTTDGETPDYSAAIKIVSDSLGLPTGKRGVDLQYGETSSDNESAGKTRALDESRLLSDAEYRSAYTQIRQYQPSLERSKITDAMVRKNMEKRKAIRNN
jgi:hypothetical protein